MQLAALIGLWLMFYCGFAASLLLQAQTSASSDSNNLHSAWDWVRLHSKVLVVRLFLSTIFSTLAIGYIPASLGLPRWSVYGAAGFIVDSLLDKFLFIFGRQVGLKVEVPQIAPPMIANPVPSESLPKVEGKP